MAKLIWRAFALPQHRVETLTVSTDSPFIEKLQNIVGL